MLSGFNTEAERTDKSARIRPDMCISELSALLRNGRISAAELTEYYSGRIAEYDGRDGLNSVAELNRNAARDARTLDKTHSGGDLPLFGLPVLVKDNIDVAGLHTTAGSLALADNIAAADSPAVARLRECGAVISGKTNMTEFANFTTQGMPGGYSSRGGQVLNAYGRDADPSGSSTGSAVAVSAGLCATALGTDTSFSVVGCATCNGVTGLKPPVGAIPQDGIVPVSHTLDSVGVLARSLSDALLVNDCIRGTRFGTIKPAEPGTLRLAVNTYNRDKVSEAQLGRYDALFARLRGAGAAFAEVSHPYTPYLKDIMRCEFRHDLEKYLAQTDAKLRTLPDIVEYYERNPETMMKYGDSQLRSALYDAAGDLSDGIYAEAQKERERLKKQLEDELSRYDAVIMTGPTNIMHFTGMPSLALRLCMADDFTPRGIILYGADEARLYGAALAVERFCEPVLPPVLIRKNDG